MVVDISSGLSLGTIEGKVGTRVGFGFSADGSAVLAVSDAADAGPASAVYRDISDESMIRAAFRAAGRSLTTDE